MSKKKMITCALCVLILIIAVFSLNRIKEGNALKQVAIENGLKDVSIIYKGKVRGYGLQEVCIKCSNFDTLTVEEMYKVDNAIQYGNFNFYVGSYSCHGNTYRVYPSTRSIYKNDKIWHDDYWNSNSYKSVIKSGGESSASAVTDDAELGTCWALAEDVVKSNLKSPSSAKFPFSYNSDGVSITKSGSVYTVKAWVEADNSFGASIRSTFTVTMEKSGAGENAKFTSKSCVID